MNDQRGLIRFRVSHPEFGSIETEAPGRLNALHRAAKEWGQRWTEIARECAIEALGPAEQKPKRKAGKGKRKK